MAAELMAEVVMIEDDLGRLNNLVAYAKVRGDIGVHVSQFASDLWSLSVMSGEKALADLVLLDVRLPKLKPELKERLPGERSPYGADAAKALRDNKRTSEIPVVIYTQFAREPEVEARLEELSDHSRYPNIVGVFRTRPTVRITLAHGMKHIRHLEVDLRRSGGQRSVFEIIPGARLTAEAVLEGRILLNGHRPRVLARVLSTGAVLARFDVGVLHGSDDNYLMVEANGLKTIFMV